MRSELAYKQSHLRLGKGRRIQTSLFKWRLDLNELNQVAVITTRRHRMRHPIVDQLRRPQADPNLAWEPVGIKARVVALLLTILLLTINFAPALLTFYDLVPPHELDNQPFNPDLYDAKGAYQCLWRNCSLVW